MPVLFFTSSGKNCVTSKLGNWFSQLFSTWYISKVVFLHIKHEYRIQKVDLHKCKISSKSDSTEIDVCALPTCGCSRSHCGTEKCLETGGTQLTDSPHHSTVYSPVWDQTATCQHLSVLQETRISSGSPALVSMRSSSNELLWFLLRLPPDSEKKHSPLALSPPSSLMFTHLTSLLNAASHISHFRCYAHKTSQFRPHAGGFLEKNPTHNISNNAHEYTHTHTHVGQLDTHPLLCHFEHLLKYSWSDDKCTHTCTQPRILLLHTHTHIRALQFKLVRAEKHLEMHTITLYCVWDAFICFTFAIVEISKVLYWQRMYARHLAFSAFFTFFTLTNWWQGFFIRSTSNWDEFHLNKMEIKTTSKIDFFVTRCDRGVASKFDYTPSKHEVLYLRHTWRGIKVHQFAVKHEIAVTSVFMLQSPSNYMCVSTAPPLKRFIWFQGMGMSK